MRLEDNPREMRLRARIDTLTDQRDQACAQVDRLVARVATLEIQLADQPPPNARYHSRLYHMKKSRDQWRERARAARASRDTWRKHAQASDALLRTIHYSRRNAIKALQSQENSGENPDAISPLETGR